MRTSFQLTCLLFGLWMGGPASANVLSDRIPYYSSQLYDRIESGTRDRRLLQALHETLNSVHIQDRSGGFDQIANQCPSGARCYQHTWLSYTRAREILFGELHLMRGDQGFGVLDVYCGHLAVEDEFKVDPPGPGRIPDHRVLNAEHTWPQSRFSNRFPKDLQKSDLHGLYPVLTRANSSRGNLEFNDVSSITSSPCPSSKRGFGSDGSRTQYFEVPESHKGNAARAIFYFATRYLLSVSPTEERALRMWHRQDPPDRIERDRNTRIFNRQKVRNPFVDHPELVELISDF